MKNKVLLFSLIILLSSGCDSDYKKDVYIYKSILNDATITLILDDEEIGEIPYIDSKEEADVIANALLIRVGTGKSEIKAKDEQGNNFSSVFIDITNYNLKIGPFKHSKNKTSRTVIKDGDHSFKDLSEGEDLIFCLE